MKFKDRYPIIVTEHMDACREFWTKHLGFTVGFNSTWFTWLTTEDGSATIAFMTPDHPSAPPGSETFGGVGLCMEFEVDDVDAAHAAVTGSGLEVGYGLTDEPFGQRRFGFRDPSGLWVDIVMQTQPAVGYWDPYMR